MMVVIIAVILLICIWVLAVQDMLSRWMDDSDFEEEEEEQEHDDSGYDWRDNIKGYRKDEEDNKKVGQD